MEGTYNLTVEQVRKLSALQVELDEFTKDVMFSHCRRICPYEKCEYKALEAQNTIDNKAHDAISRLGTLYLSTHETNRHVIAAVNHFAKWADKQQCQ